MDRRSAVSQANEMNIYRPGPVGGGRERLIIGIVEPTQLIIRIHYGPSLYCSTTLDPLG